VGGAFYVCRNRPWPRLSEFGPKLGAGFLADARIRKIWAHRLQRNPWSHSWWVRELPATTCPSREVFDLSLHFKQRSPSNPCRGRKPPTRTKSPFLIGLPPRRDRRLALADGSFLIVWFAGPYCSRMKGIHSRDFRRWAFKPKVAQRSRS